MSKETVILGVMLQNRTKIATEFQEVITKHGCAIKTRVGLHSTGSDFCSPNGIILLEVIGEKEEVSNLEEAIKGINGAQVQKMVFAA